jgi:hypothetical protein
MAIVYNPQNLKRAAETTEAINAIPNRWGLTNQLGLFTNEFKSQKTILIPRRTEADVLLVDRNWDERDSTLIGVEQDMLPVKVPHFPAKDAITPNDVDGVINVEELINGFNLETVDNVRMDKMGMMRQAFANTLEYSRMYMITTGTVYSPNNTLRTSYGTTYNWYTEFGITRTEVEVDLANAAVNPKTLLEQVADSIQLGYLGGGVINSNIVLASPEFYDALASHPYVIDSVKYINFPGVSENLLLGTTRGGLGLDARYQTMTFGSMTYIRVPGGYGGQRFIPAGDAYAFPQTSGLFKTFFAPRNTFTDVNTPAQEVYWWEGVDARGTMIEIEGESNFLNFMAYPGSVVRMYLAA